MLLLIDEAEVHLIVRQHLDGLTTYRADGGLLVTLLLFRRILSTIVLADFSLILIHDVFRWQRRVPPSPFFEPIYRL